jgi:hypothetical protein
MFMAAPLINVRYFPERVFLEQGAFQQSVNFEFRFQTESNETMELLEVTANGFDKQNQLLFKFPLNNFGVIPPILIVPERKIEPGKMLEIFNPLPNFPLEYPIHRLCYQFRFMNEKGSQARTEVSVYPVVYKQKTTLVLPFAGTSLVTEGHDLLTHHRRNFPSTHPLIQQIGITGNNSRFAYDFVLVDDELKMFKNSPHSNEDFFCWRKPVLCPGDGKIISVANDLPDNEFNKPPLFDVEAHIREPEKSMKQHLGNHAIIDHGNSEFSVLVHILKGSVQVNAGDKVIKGELIGRVGTSGDSFFPHIHYQFQDGKSLLNSEGLPSKFESFDLVIGDKTRRIEGLCPNTGMIVRCEQQFKR